MEIYFFGHASFRLKGKTGITVVTDPFDPEMVGLKYPATEANIVTISHFHQDHSRADLVSDPPAVAKKVIEGPGEYEIAGVSILGFSTFHDNNKGAVRGKNTIYVIEMDGLRIAHMGDLGHTLSEELIEDLGDIDIMMIPIGGHFTIGPAEAVQVVQDVEPQVIIPMHYQMTGLKPETFKELAPVEPFLREMGITSENLPKLVIKKEDIAEEQKVVVLEKR